MTAKTSEIEHLSPVVESWQTLLQLNTAAKKEKAQLNETLRVIAVQAQILDKQFGHEFPRTESFPEKLMVFNTPLGIVLAERRQIEKGQVLMSFLPFYGVESIRDLEKLADSPAQLEQLQASFQGTSTVIFDTKTNYAAGSDYTVTVHPTLVGYSSPEKGMDSVFPGVHIPQSAYGYYHQFSYVNTSESSSQLEEIMYTGKKLNPLVHMASLMDVMRDPLVTLIQPDNRGEFLYKVREALLQPLSPRK